jgi:hypothetical protein
MIAQEEDFWRYAKNVPRWECRNEADVRKLKEWTIHQLDLLDRAEQEALEASVDPADLILTEKEMKALERDINLRLARGRIASAVKENDRARVLRIAGDDPELLRYALRLALTPRGRGRARGEKRPGDISDVRKEVLRYAAADVRRIRTLWTQHFNGRWKRKEAPTAIAIAAERYNFSEEMLLNYLKNLRRPKSRI